MATACITGATSGLGREFSIQLAEKKYDLILIARNIEVLKPLAASLPVKCEIICCDLSDEEQCLKLSNQISKFNIDVFINNAGIGYVGSINNSDITKDIQVINLNIKAVQILTDSILMNFIKKDSGFILNVASSAGFFNGGPYMASYYASKSYVLSYTCALWRELRDSKSSISVSVLCPGPVNTEFNKKAGVISPLKGISASFCVSYALKKMFKKKLIIIPSFRMKLACLSPRFLSIKQNLYICSIQQKKKLRIKK